MFSVDSSYTGDSVESNLNCIPPGLRATYLSIGSPTDVLQLEGYRGIEAYCRNEQVICSLDTMRLLNRLFFRNVTKAHFGNNPPCTYKLHWHRLIPPSRTERKTSSSIIGEEDVKRKKKKQRRIRQRKKQWHVEPRGKSDCKHLRRMRGQLAELTAPVAIPTKKLEFSVKM